ncbi:MAG: class I SAM-dependent methyltransferase [Myxococcota bacterium]
MLMSWDQQLQQILHKSPEMPAQRMRFHLERALPNLPWLLQQNEKSIWFTGFGLSLAPILFAQYNCQVWATDCSQVAIQHLKQHQRVSWAEYLPDWPALLTQHKLSTPSHPPLMLHIQQQDFCVYAPPIAQDLIFNTRALFCLPLQQQKHALCHFFQCLRPGGLLVLEFHILSTQQRHAIQSQLKAIGYQDAKDTQSAKDDTTKMFLLRTIMPNV